MFIKTIPKVDKKTKKCYYYYRLCESYRVGGKPRHRTILNLGSLEELPNRQDHKLLADRIEQIIRGEQPLFPPENETIERLAHYYAQLIIDQQLVDTPSSKSGRKREDLVETSDYQLVNVNSLSHERVREIGAEWLCQEALEQLGLEPALRSLGWERKWIERALVYLIARSVYPASDRQTAHWLQQNSGLCELYHLPPGKVNRYHLYEVSKRLYKHKTEIESYLRERTGELFSLEDQIWIYDLTNTYFEGEKEESEKAHYGRSKEKRNDAKLLSLALVVDRYGFVKYSQIYEGNIRESKTLRKTLADLRGKENHKGSKQVIVMDAGIATEENLALLREEGYDYVCVPLSKPDTKLPEREEEELSTFQDQRGNQIQAQWINFPGEEDNFLYIESERKGEKEKSIQELHCLRYEAGLQAIKEGIGKKGGVKRVEKVYERLGRWKEKCPSVHRLYEVELKSDKGIVQEISWQKVKERSKKPGTYFIRTTIPEQEEKTVWDIYHTAQEIETCFRILKTDLRVRPIYHQKDKASEAHIYGSVLAYTIVNSIRHQLKARGINYDWSNIVRIMNSQKIVTSSLPTQSGGTIYLKKCSEPEEEVRKIYQALNYRDRPFWQKKSVLPENGSP
jgi:transposase